VLQRQADVVPAIQQTPALKLVHDEHGTKPGSIANLTALEVNG
jgi:hypothetical protein